ncbi:cation transporter [Nakamurella flavida]|uniref:Cation transporter n=1 Tax=Nakamurella flavida TaxID=363630 RepID=A0A938YQT7_9ACTN|nr:cation diffusion facilitator family transporter [Nakamurella flavida]MBM9477724.1 cation transporter [Nakamurella flavida]MDP9779276.1 cobalt-zinc-cadmium efflux system protein [Nakamurella flavida]
MSGHHGHSGGHGGHGAGNGGSDGGSASTAGRFRGRLAVTFALTAGFFVVELVVGLVTNSLALIADAGHMATDVVALGASLLATRIAARPDGTGRWSYGRYRAEVFSAGLTVLLMLGVGVFVIVEAVGRAGEGGEVAVSSLPLLIVGLIGLAINAVGLILLKAGSKESLNLRAAYLEVLGDAAGSIGVIIAAGLIAWTGSSVWDLVVALIIAVFVLVRAVGLGRSVLRVLGQQVPDGVDVGVVAADLGAVQGVVSVHDLHLWELTSGMTVATAHLVTTPGVDAHRVLDQARDVLALQHAIAHATLQVEPADHTSCGEIGW